MCGQRWLDSYLKELRSSPDSEALTKLVMTELEKETFKFGNGGVKASYSRY